MANTVGDIRARFAAAQDKINKEREVQSELLYESYVNVAIVAKKEAQQKLFDSINDDKFGGVCPWAKIKFKDTNGVKAQADGRLWVDSLNKNTFKIIYDYLMQDRRSANELFNIGRSDTAIGAGEVMFAYIVENMTIGGGAADTDLAIFNKNWSPVKGSSGICELKESQTNKGMLVGWRTGAKHQGINSTYVPQLTALYDAVKHNISEINPNEAVGAKLAASGGWVNEWGTVGGKRFRHIENLTDEEIDLKSSRDRDFKIGPSKEDNDKIVVNYNGEVLGNIGDAKTTEAIKEIISVSGSGVKSFAKIQDEVIKEVGKIPTPFLFIESKKNQIINFHYYESLPGNVDGLQIYAITQGKFKYKIKPNEV